jgi:hypothetical protein
MLSSVLMNVSVSKVRWGRLGLSVAVLVFSGACSFDSGGLTTSDGQPSDLALDAPSRPEGGPELGLDGGDGSVLDQGIDGPDAGVFDGAVDSGAEAGLDAGADADVGPGTDLGPDSAPDLGPDQGGPLLPTLGSGDGRLVFGSASVSDPSLVYTFRAATQSLSVEGVRPVVAEPYWVRYAEVAGQETMVVEHREANKTKLTVLRWDGSAWVAGPTRTEANGVDLNKRDIALATESGSGDALLVYGGQQNAPFFATFLNGAWSALAPISGVAGFNSKVLWTELVAAPTGDEIVLLVADESSRLLALSWDGAAWVPSSFLVVASSLKENAKAKTLSTRPFDAAFEQQSGDLLVVWGREGSTGVRYRRREAGVWQSSQGSSKALSGGEVHFVDLAAEPGSDRIAAGFFDLGDGTERLGLGIWTGSAWTDEGEVDGQIRDFNDGARGDFPGAVAWLGNSGRAVCLLADDSPKFSWWEWSSATSGWQSRGGIVLPGNKAVESVQLRGGAAVRPWGSSPTPPASCTVCITMAPPGPSSLQPLSSAISRKDSRPFDIMLK